MPNEHTSSLRPITPFKRAVFWCVLVVLVFLAGEGLARAYRSYVSAETVHPGYPKGLWVPDEDFEYRLRPGFEGFFRSDDYRRVPIVINRDGYRDGPFGRRREGVWRVVVLGDSVTFGSGVRAELRYTERLERALRNAGRRVEVMNLGVNSYTFFHYLRQVRSDVAAYDPGLVLVGFCLNDLAPKESSRPRLLVHEQADGARATETASLEGWIREASALVWLGSTFRNARSAQAEEHRRRGRERQWLKWMNGVVGQWRNAAVREQLERDLLAMREELREQERDLLVLILPVKHALRDPLRYGGPRTRLASMLRALDIAYVDLHESLEGVPDLDGHFLSGDAVHLSAKGHAVIADDLAARVLR